MVPFRNWVTAFTVPELGTWTHPDVNAFFTGVQGLPQDEAFKQIKDYLTANPDTKAQMDAIQAPGDDLRARCGIPVSNIVRGVL